MKTLRLLTIMLTALSLSAAFAHLLEMPAKLNYDGALWLTLLQTLYPTYGMVSGIGEIGAVVATVILTVAVRSAPRVFHWSLLAALCMVVTHAIFWIWVQPVNTELVPLAPDALPTNWTQLRNQWEYGHAVRAILQIVALAALVMSILVEPITGDEAQ